MSALLLPLAAQHFKTGSVLSLVIPLGVLIAVTIWYVVAFPHESDDS
jgi:hypothetical protein